MKFSQLNLEGERIIKGIINSIHTKPGVTRGREWTLIIVSVDGESYSGFKGSIPRLEELQEGQAIEITYKQNGIYKNIVELKLEGDKTPEELLAPATIKKLEAVRKTMEKTGKNAYSWTAADEKVLQEEMAKND